MPVSRIRSSPWNTWRLLVSMRRSPSSITPELGMPLTCSFSTRRSTQRMRASSSLGLNGLTT